MRILIVGAGIAGLAAAVDLHATGHEVVVVERSDELRAGGSPIDIRGDSIDVVDKMGLGDLIRAGRIDMSERVQFVDRTGAVVAALPYAEIGDSADDFEVSREDLLTILHGAVGRSTQLRFGESIAALDDDGSGVQVGFTSGLTERYDLVVGADGMHSATRRLVFGPEQQFLRHLGYYVGFAKLPGYVSNSRTNPMYNYPDRMIGIAAYRDKALAVYMFRSEWIDYDYHDLEVQRQILADAYTGHSEWRIPELVEAARRDPDFYFDSVSQIHMPTWHRGRVVLVGDAAHCSSNLSGRGTSLALTGTWFLAQALRDHPGDLRSALAQYEQDQRPHAARSQATAGPGGQRLLPATQEEIDARNQTYRAAEI